MTKSKKKSPDRLTNLSKMFDWSVEISHIKNGLPVLQQNEEVFF